MKYNASKGRFPTEETPALVETSRRGRRTANWKVSGAVQLWWPAGYGAQQLCDVEV
ncbi:hypothetical protein OH77DRAFT_1431305 [Trametes cingulata]|nr:hypothetical protein OH77DRAFT_1431305 [Trametes cingulata]